MDNFKSNKHDGALTLLPASGIASYFSSAENLNVLYVFAEVLYLNFELKGF